MVLDNEEIPTDKIKQCLPNTWHLCDKQNRPVWVFQVGFIKVSDLLNAVNAESVKRFFVQ